MVSLEDASLLNTLPDYDIQLTTKPFIAHFKVRMTTESEFVDL